MTRPSQAAVARVYIEHFVMIAIFFPVTGAKPVRGPTVQKSTTDLVISPELRRTPDTSRPQTELGTSWVSDSAFVNPCKDSRASERVAQPDSASGNARAPLSPAAASLRDIWPALPLIIPPVSAALRANGGVDVETRQRGGAWRFGCDGDTRSIL